MPGLTILCQAQGSESLHESSKFHENTLSLSHLHCTVQVNATWNAGDNESARRNSRIAVRCNICSIIIGIVTAITSSGIAYVLIVLSALR